MNKTWLKLSAALVVLGLGLAAVGAGVEGPGYWAIYKSVFVDWDDDALPSANKTTVVIRYPGVELKNGEYDWAAVHDMENFMVRIEVQKVFLQEAGLGPFQEHAPSIASPAVKEDGP